MVFGFLLQYLELREFEYDVRTFVDFYTVSGKPAETIAPNCFRSWLIGCFQYSA